jgi:hypothetical protein
MNALDDHFLQSGFGWDRELRHRGQLAEAEIDRCGDDGRYKAGGQEDPLRKPGSEA